MNTTIESINYKDRTVTLETEVEYTSGSSFNSYYGSMPVYEDDYYDAEYELTVNPLDLLAELFSWNEDEEAFIEQKYPRIYKEYLYERDFKAILALFKHYLNNGLLEEYIQEEAQSQYDNDRDYDDGDYDDRDYYNSYCY